MAYRLRWLNLLALLVIFAVPAAALAKPGQHVRCQSVRGHYNYCPADTRGGVTVVDRLSDSSCVYGSTWGYDRKGIWVDNGCRAVFMTGSRERHGSVRPRDYYYRDRYEGRPYYGGYWSRPPRSDWRGWRDTPPQVYCPYGYVRNGKCIDSQSYGRGRLDFYPRAK